MGLSKPRLRSSQTLARGWTKKQAKNKPKQRRGLGTCKVNIKGYCGKTHKPSMDALRAPV